MRTKETIYKTTGDNFRIKIWDVINQNWIYIGTEKGIENALERLKNEQINYYKDKSYLLPKCIAIDFKNKCFSFAIYYNKKTIINKRCTTLESAILEKQNFLLKLL
jgi:hypothetical protein